jgi:hypothetical protein
LSYLENQVVGLKKIDFPDTLKQGVKKIDVKTVFINEPGLYSLIMRSKLIKPSSFKNGFTLALKTGVFSRFFLLFSLPLKIGGVFTIFSAFLLTLENRGCFP